mmetsp:Transcript_5226/g.14097  ORF Transcript_5226/g.14097 Transcript_5226/m.14097 type:complete len:230 (-) Transcript_5226:725-1414(-)
MLSLLLLLLLPQTVNSRSNWELAVEREWVVDRSEVSWHSCAPHLWFRILHQWRQGRRQRCLPRWREGGVLPTRVVGIGLARAAFTTEIFLRQILHHVCHVRLGLLASSAATSTALVRHLHELLLLRPILLEQRAHGLGRHLLVLPAPHHQTSGYQVLRTAGLLLGDQHFSCVPCLLLLEAFRGIQHGHAHLAVSAVELPIHLECALAVVRVDWDSAFVLDQKYCTPRVA